MKTVWIVSRVTVLVLLAALMLFAMPAQVRGDTTHVNTITVNTLIDENDNSCTDGDCSLRDAIEVAAAGDKIVFDVSGTIDLAHGEIMLAKDITINGPGADLLKIDGDRVTRLFLIQPAVNVVFNGVTLANGSIVGDIGAQVYGAGIYNMGMLTVNDCVFAANIGDYAYGGAIASPGTLTITKSSFSDNGANAYYNESASGGAIWTSGPATVSDSTFTGNYSKNWGGAISSMSTLTVHHSTFSGNTTASTGGAIAGSNGSTEVDQSTFSNNYSNAFGGAFYNSGGTVDIRESLFVGNSALTLGGAAYTSGTVTISNSTFADNIGDGGSIWNNGELDLINSTLYNSQSHNIYSSKPFTATNTIFVSLGNAENCLVESITDGGGNLRWPENDTSCVGAYGDPKLGPLADNGGPTQTMAIGTDSAALDIGNNANCAAAPVNNLDQRGVARPQDGDGDGNAVCDSGAFEYAPPIITFEETSPAISFNGWRGKENANATGGIYHESNSKNDSVTFKFTASSVMWLTKKGPDMGIAQVTIDGVNKGTVDLYNASEQWQFAKTFKKLGNAKHTLVLKVTGNKNSNASAATVGVDGFKVGSTVTEDTARNVRYDTWNGKANAAASGGSYRASKAASARVSMVFHGTRIVWVTAKGPKFGKADVLIDGLGRGTFDLYAATPQWQVPIEFTGLGAGPHTLEIRVLGKKNAQSAGAAVVVDAFR